VSDTFFTEQDTTGKGAAKFASPTWLVQLESPGVRKVYHYPKGFKFLNFRSNAGKSRFCPLCMRLAQRNSRHITDYNDPVAERMFELGRTTISQTTNLPKRSLPFRSTISETQNARANK
jgi:hypothetical protein